MYKDHIVKARMTDSAAFMGAVAASFSSSRFSAAWVKAASPI
jgi:hypothetical protein